MFRAAAWAQCPGTRENRLLTGKVSRGAGLSHPIWNEAACRRVYGRVGKG